MAARQVLLDGRRPDVARVLQAQRREQALVRVAVEARPGDGLDGTLQEQHGFARIRVLGPRRQQHRQRPAHLVVARPPVRQPGAVREHHARRDEMLPGLVPQVVVAEVPGQRRIEVEPSLLDQLQRAEREDGLGHRAGFEDRVGRHRVAAAGIADAEALRPAHAAVLDDGDGHPGHVVLLHQDRDLLLQPRQVRAEALVGDGCRRHDALHGRGGRQPHVGLRIPQRRRDLGDGRAGARADAPERGEGRAADVRLRARQQRAQFGDRGHAVRARARERGEAGDHESLVVLRQLSRQCRHEAIDPGAGLVQGHRRGPALLRGALREDPVDGVEGIDTRGGQRARGLAGHVEVAVVEQRGDAPQRRPGRVGGRDQPIERGLALLGRRGGQRRLNAGILARRRGGGRGDDEQQQSATGDPARRPTERQTHANILPRTTGILKRPARDPLSRPGAKLPNGAA